MDLHTLTRFFMWCSIINGGLLLLLGCIYLIAPGLTYRLQKFWFPLPEETFTIVFYSFIGLFKIFVIIFNLVPYLALLVIQ